MGKKNGELAPGNRRKRKPRGKPFKKGNDAGKDTQFGPGNTANLSGRPKAIFTDCYRKVLEKVADFNEEEILKPLRPARGDTYADLIAKQVVTTAVTGVLDAVTELREVVDGKVKEKKEISGPEGGPIKTVQIDYAKLKKNVAAAYELSESADE